MNRPRDALIDQESSHTSQDPVDSLISSSTIAEPQMTKSYEDLWFQRELERSKELSEQIAEALGELRALRSILSRRYRPDLEGQVQRLSIERDEMIITWGQALLGLCDDGATLLLQEPSGERVTLYPPNNVSHAGVPSVESSIEPLILHLKRPQNDLEESEDEGRILGEGRDLSPSSFRQEGALPNLISSIDRELPYEGSSSIIDDDSEETDDPGIADAPTLSLTQFSLEELRDQMLSPKGWNTEDSLDSEIEDDSILELATALVVRLGRPRELSMGQLKEHLIELEAEVECCQSWSVFEQDTQHAIVTLVTSRLRAIQDHIGESPFDQDRIAKMFRRLTRFSSDFRPGFIHGLSREKVPEHDSWKNDEIQAWSRLEVLLSIKPQLPNLSTERAEQLNHLRSILSQEEEIKDFSNVLRAAVTECLNSGFTQENPHLVKVLGEHLSHLSGKRFKKLRLAASNLRF